MYLVGIFILWTLHKVPLLFMNEWVGELVWKKKTNHIRKMAGSEDAPTHLVGSRQRARAPYTVVLYYQIDEVSERN